jgi:hypothetical protein
MPSRYGQLPGFGLLKGKIDSGPQSGSGRSIDLTDVAGGGKMSQRLQFHLINLLAGSGQTILLRKIIGCVKVDFLQKPTSGIGSVGFLLCPEVGIERRNSGDWVIGLWPTAQKF